MSPCIRSSVALAVTLSFAPAAHAMIPFMMLFGGGMMTKDAKERDRPAEAPRAAETPAPAPATPHPQSQASAAPAGPGAAEEAVARPRATHDQAEIKSDGSP